MEHARTHEYMIHDIDYLDHLERVANTWAKTGWRVVSVTEMMRGFRMLLERPWADRSDG